MCVMLGEICETADRDNSHSTQFGDMLRSQRNGMKQRENFL